MTLSPEQHTRLCAENKAQILRIERLSPNDGEGMRTVVFFKGCPLRCKWCAAPESQKGLPEIAYNREKCLFCLKCAAVCPAKAIAADRDRHMIRIDRMACNVCGACKRVCSGGAISRFGGLMSVEEIMRQIRRDEIFYFHSGGGVTLSGGDVLMQADFAGKLLRACREEEINTSAELAMYGSYEKVRKIFPYLNSVFVDVKLMDSQKHKDWTGVPNERILENIRLASEEFADVRMHIRVPLIPGVNTDRRNLEETAAFCAGLRNVKALEFLPYHRLGQAAYGKLQRENVCREMAALKNEEAENMVRFLTEKKQPFSVRVAGKTVAGV